MNHDELTGRASGHIQDLRDPQCRLHCHAVTPFLRLRRAARQHGMDLLAQSSFRDFPRQLRIWNDKFNGIRPLLSAAGEPVNGAALTPEQRVDVILLWSALPGASRHHWGTDVDLIDANALPAGYQVQLTAAEFASGGPFAALDAWLDEYAPRFGFFRPFRGVRSGVQPEAWHYSFAPVAEGARQALSVAVLRAALTAAPLAGKEIVLKRIEELHQRCVARIDMP